MSSRLCAVSATPEVGDTAEVILPCQYFDLSGGSLSGEQRLMFALLVDAINVYQRGVTSRVAVARRLYIDAEQWIMTYRPARGALSFETACEAVGIDALLLRRRLLDWKYNVQRELALWSRVRLGRPPRRGAAGLRRIHPAARSVGST